MTSPREAASSRILVPLYPFLHSLMESGFYKDLLLSIHDSVDGIVNELMSFSPEMPSHIQKERLSKKLQ